MALTAHLQFGNNQAGRYNADYLVVGCHCSYRRSHNGLRPDGQPHCDSVEVSLVAPGREDQTLNEWFINMEEMSGRIVFDLSSSSPDDSQPTRILLFENARCFRIEESYDKETRFRRLIKLCFEADTITIDEITFNQ